MRVACLVLAAQLVSAPAAALTISGAPAVVPEPASWALLTMGFGLIGAATRRRAMSQAA